LALMENGKIYSKKPCYKEFRLGDVRDSQANISKSKIMLGYVPEYDIVEGIAKTIPWYLQKYI